MANPVWPLTLPQAPLAGSYSETGDGNVVRSAPELGPPKVRKRYSRELVTYQISLILTDAQRAAFLTFYSGAAQGGAQWFDWIDFATQALQSYRFVPPRPTFSLVKVGTWRADFQLEAFV